LTHEYLEVFIAGFPIARLLCIEIETFESAVKYFEIVHGELVMRETDRFLTSTIKIQSIEFAYIQ